MRLWPRSILGQVLVLVLGALLLAQVIGLAISSDARVRAMRHARLLDQMERVAAVALLYEQTAPDLRDSVLRLSNSPLARFRVDGAPMVAHSDDSAGPYLQRLTQALDGPPRDLRIRVTDAPVRDTSHDPNRRRPVELALSLQLQGGQWLNVATRMIPMDRGLNRATTFSFLLSAVLIALAVWVVLRRMLNPLRGLADSAERFGRGEAVAPVPETGPIEMQQLARSFNDMQARLTRHVSDRTQMLAALGHDLRSPLTALRVRAEMIDDDETRDRMVASLEEMQGMVDSTLAFARGVESQEPTVSIDLADLLADLISEATDAGQPVTATELTPGIVTRLRLGLMRRALRNLLDNAVRYGGQADLTLHRKGAQAEITIADRGPGIPAAARERVFAPFVRLEASRSRETGGTGLGLSIARSIIQAHGGQIVLDDRPGGGLLVRVTLPLQARG